MKVESRKRLHSDRVSFHHDVVLICETAEESRILDLLGEAVTPSGVISRPPAEIRLSDDMDSHYVILRGAGD